MGAGGEQGRAHDPVRLLSRRSEYGYTDRVDQALRDEPEAVSPDEQGRQTAMAHRRAELMRLEAFHLLSRAVNTACDQFTATVHDQELGSGVRQIRRATQVVGKKVGAQ